MIALAATIKRISHDEDGESLVTFRVPASDLAVCVGLAALHRTLLRLTVDVEADAPVAPLRDMPSPAQYAKSEVLLRSLGWTEDVWRPKLKALCGVEHRNELTATQMSQWLSELERHVADAELADLDVPF